MIQTIRRNLVLVGSLSKGTGDANLGMIAAGVAFYAMMAVFPGITALVTLWGYFADPMLVEEQFAILEPVVPEDTYNILIAQVRSIADGPKAVLGWTSVISIAAAIWATRAGVAAILRGINTAYGTSPRGGLKGMVFALGLTVLLIVVALVAMAAVVAIPIVVSYLPLGSLGGVTLEILRWLTAVAVLLLGLGLLYRFGPNRSVAPTPIVSPGSVLAVALWGVASVGFSTYLKDFSDYSEVYGSLGAVIGTLMWLYISAFVVLFGGLTNAVLERTAAEAPNDAIDDTAQPEQDPLEQVAGGNAGANAGPDSTVSAASTAEQATG